MIKKHLMTSVALASSLLPSASFAEINIVITPSGQEQSIADVNAQVEVITREEIEQTGASDIAELVATRAGVDIGRNGGNGQLTSIFIRGANSDHTLVLVDGVNIAPDIGQAPIQNIDLNAVERIEIVKGGAATLYGSGALGGVINIITRKHDGNKPFTARANTTAGSYDLKKYSASVDYKNDLITGGLLFGHQESKGPSAQKKPIDEDAYENQNVKAYFGVDNGSTSLKLDYLTSEGDVEYDSFGADAEQRFDSDVVKLQAQQNMNNVSVQLSASRMNDRLNQKVKNYFGKLEYANTRRDNVDANVRYTLDLNNQIMLGADIEKLKNDKLAGNTQYDIKRESTGIYSTYDFRNQSHEFNVSLRHSDFEGYSPKTFGGVSYAFSIFDNTKIFLNADKAFKVPTLTNLYGGGGSENLKTEVSKSAELGIKTSMGDHHIKTTFFNSKTENLLSTNTTTYTLENIPKATNRGLEVSYQKLGDNINYHANATIQKPMNKNSGELLARRSKLSLNTGLNYRNKLWGAGFNLSHVGKRENSDFDTNILKAYTLLDLSASYFQSENITLRGTVKNVGNAKYETAKGYNNPGVAYQISTDIKF